MLRRIKERLFKKKKYLIKSLPKIWSEEGKEVAPQEKKKVSGASEIDIEKSKFSTPEKIAVMPRIFPQDLPSGYAEDRIVLQVRDPWWIHAYWEITPQITHRLKERLGDTFFSAEKVLRVYDVSYIIFDGTNAHRFFDIQINPHANNWYIDTGGPGRSWCVDLGLKLANGEFITIVRSNTVQAPIEGPSWMTDEEWMIPDDMFARLYGMGFGLGRSSPVGRAWQEKIRKEIISSPRVSSLASPVKKILPEKKFWLTVDTELIVYGATEPSAKVAIQGRPINLRPDGTFTLRFALPDGKQVIPVVATPLDGADTKTVTPIVSKKTQ